MMGNRKSLTKKTRFDVFKRDGFVCQYCGNTPPAVVLEVDHIRPVSKGGSNDVDNLLTSCFDCNRGKAANELSVAPVSVAKKAELLAEKEEQIKAYRRLVKAKKRRQDKDIDSLQNILAEEFSRVFTDKFRESVRAYFLESLPFDELEGAMYKACGKCTDADQAVKYFCGICWNKIKGRSRY